MFHATERETFILRTLAGDSIIEESELFKILSEKETQTEQTFKNALEGCIAKGFIQKFDENGKSFYKITDNGKNQI